VRAAPGRVVSTPSAAVSTPSAAVSTPSAAVLAPGAPMTDVLQPATSTGAPDGVEQRRILVTEVPGPRSQALHARKVSAVAAGVGTTLLVYIERAGGAILVDVDGNHLIDFGSGIAVTSVGNAAPEVVSRVQGQVAEFTHTCFMVTPYEGYVAVCEALNALTPGDFAKRTALFNSGAEAVENAVKIARRFTGRDAVVVFDHAYHGRTNLTMAMTAKNMPYKDGFGPFAGEIYRAPMSYPFREPAPITGEQAAARATSIIEKQVGANRVAAVVIEPIQGEGGFIVPAPGFLAGIRDWCTANDVLFIADEIQSGFARTGAMFAVEHEGVVPDLVTTAKGIAGGLPLAAVTGRADVMDSVHSGGLGGTYGGNPVACAAALGAIATVEQQDLVGAARRIESVMKPRLEALAVQFPQIGDVRGRGAMLAVEIVKPGTTEPDAAETARVSAACHRAGLLTLTCGTYGNVLRFLPPLVIGEDLLVEGLDLLRSAFAG
jgi:4-aminobutyrate aminotransferase/(S)-3-amino-2-methylpropionate transaminase